MPERQTGAPHEPQPVLVPALRFLVYWFTFGFILPDSPKWCRAAFRASVLLLFAAGSAQQKDDDISRGGHPWKDPSGKCWTLEYPKFAAPIPISARQYQFYCSTHALAEAAYLISWLVILAVLAYRHFVCHERVSAYSRPA